jgi:hypothetical protein
MSKRPGRRSTNWRASRLTNYKGDHPVRHSAEKHSPSDGIMRTLARSRKGAEESAQSGCCGPQVTLSIRLALLTLGKEIPNG